jgi:hypothetical protein
VADVFLKSQGSSSISLPKAKSREELAAALSGMEAGDADLLRMEVDTMGEDWLLALQDELTKPYFLSVSQSVLVTVRGDGVAWYAGVKLNSSSKGS